MSYKMKFCRKNFIIIVDYFLTINLNSTNRYFDLMAFHMIKKVIITDD